MIYLDGHRRYVCDLSGRNCSCGEWQMTGIPCAHVVACVKLPNASSVYSLLDDFYSQSKQQVLFTHYLPPVELFENHDDDIMRQGPPDYENPVVKPRPPIITRPAGRPRVRPLSPRLIWLLFNNNVESASNMDITSVVARIHLLRKVKFHCGGWHSILSFGKPA